MSGPAISLDNRFANPAATSLRSWLFRAADDPTARHPRQLPDTLDLREHAPLFRRTLQSAPAGVELGFPVVLGDGGRLEFPAELAAQARYQAFHTGGRYIGTFHVHPPVPEVGSGAAPRPSAPFFDPQDLAAALRSDYAGFMELLLVDDRLFVLVRTNPYLYISAHHVSRNPLLLAEPHADLIRRYGSRDPGDPQWAEHYRRAAVYWFQRYQLALYEGAPDKPLQRTFTPESTW